MKNANQPISPCIMQKVGDNNYRLSKGNGDPKEWQVPMAGLTKLEYFTAMAMQGILANSPDWSDSEQAKDWVARNSVEYAVKTLGQLETLNQ